MKENLNELRDSKDKMLKILYSNKKIKEEVKLQMQEKKLNFASEILKNFDKSIEDYTISFYSKNTLVIKDYNLFLEDVKKIIELYPVFKLNIYSSGILNLDEAGSVEVILRLKEELEDYINFITGKITEDEIEGYYLDAYIKTIDLDNFNIMK